MDVTFWVDLFRISNFENRTTGSKVSHFKAFHQICAYLWPLGTYRYAIGDYIQPVDIFWVCVRHYTILWVFHEKPTLPCLMCPLCIVPPALKLHSKAPHHLGYCETLWKTILLIHFRWQPVDVIIRQETRPIFHANTMVRISSNSGCPPLSTCHSIFFQYHFISIVRVPLIFYTNFLDVLEWG